MSQQHAPVPIGTDKVTFRSCATEVFRWVRAGTVRTKAMPAQLQRLAQDLAAAWEDSAKNS